MITSPPPEPNVRAHPRWGSGLPARGQTTSFWNYRRRLWAAMAAAAILHGAVYFLVPQIVTTRPSLDEDEGAAVIEAELVAGDKVAAEATPAEAFQPPPSVEQVQPTPEPPRTEPTPPEPAPAEPTSGTAKVSLPPPPVSPQRTAAPVPKARPTASQSPRVDDPAQRGDNRGLRAGSIDGRNGPGNSLPKTLSRVEPRTPTPAELGGIRRRIIVALIVDVSGRPTDLSIAESCGVPRLDREALDVVRLWRFKPGTRKGLPAPHRATAELIHYPPRE
jgi:periplasmic protein TonB